jgi:hypothetical protein
MTKYLIKESGFDELYYHGFESDLPVEDLQNRLNKIISGIEMNCEFDFFGHVFYKQKYNEFFILTLEQFWQNSLVKHFDD